MSSIYNIHQYKNHPNPIMEQLIKDKDSYFELEDSIKYNYDTVKSIFSYFHHDYDFLITVCDDISQNVQEDWTLEFLLQTIDILKRKESIPLEKYIHDPNTVIESSLSSWKMNAFTFNFLFGMKEEQILRSVKMILDENPNSNFGVGFRFIEEHFYYSEIIMNHFAKHFLSQIFLELDLERYLHENYNSYDEFVSKSGIQVFIHNYISKRDTSLDYYTIKYPECLHELTYAFQYIKEGWSYYTESHVNRIYEQIAFDVDYYIRNFENAPYSIDEFRDIAFYVSYQLGILDNFFYFLVGRDDEYLQMKTVECEELSRENNGIDSTIVYAQMKKMMNDSLEKITDRQYKHKLKMKQLAIQKATISTK